MNWNRCTACGTYFDGARFAHCNICGADASRGARAPARGRPNALAGVPIRGQAMVGPPGEPPPAVELQAARDRSISNYVVLGAIILGLAGPCMDAGTRRTPLTPTLIGIAVMLLVLAIHGAGVRRSENPLGHALGKFAGGTLAAIGWIAVAIVLLYVGMIALLFVVCIVGGAVSGS